MTTAPGIVHVVDDDVSWRESVGRLMSAAGYAVALHDSAEAFLEMAHVEAPGCVLLDQHMPGLTGLQLQKRLGAMRHALPIIFVSGYGDVPTIVLAMRAGAQNFLTKQVAPEVIVGAVQEAIARDREDLAKQEHLDLLRARIGAMTPTERKVFDLVVRGKLHKHIADELGTTERTIKWHRHNFMQKLQIRSFAELVSLAERLDLVRAHELPNTESK